MFIYLYICVYLYEFIFMQVSTKAREHLDALKWQAIVSCLTDIGAVDQTLVFCKSNKHSSILWRRFPLSQPKKTLAKMSYPERQCLGMVGDEETHIGTERSGIKLEVWVMNKLTFQNSY